MRVLITGGAGFIGSHLAELLLRRGFAIRVLDDFSTGRRENLAAALEVAGPAAQVTGASGQAALEVIEGDVADPAVAERSAMGCSAVFHLAAVASVQASVEDPLGTSRTNYTGTLSLLEAARRVGVQRFVYASSAAVYGDAAELPISESAALRPLSPYAVDKLAGEYQLAHYHRQGFLTGSAFRFFNVFGPRQDPSSPYSGVISILADRVSRGEPVTIHGDGRQTRDFVFVADLVRVLADSLEWPRLSKLPVVNIGRGESVSILDLLEAVEQVAGRSVPRAFARPRAGDIRDSLADIGRLRQLAPDLDFTPLIEGLAATLDAMREQAAGA